MAFRDRYSKNFVTPEEYEGLAKQALQGPNGWLLFVACNAGIDFAHSVKAEYESMVRERGCPTCEVPIIGSREKPVTAIFADTETNPRLTLPVSGSNAFVFQSAHNPTSGYTVNENVQQLVQVVRTLRAHRAQTITVVTPYCPYSRQDKPSFMKRESALAKLFADQLKMAGANVHFSYHPHTYALHGFYEPEMQFVALSGMSYMVEMFEHMVGRDDVIVVSTDAGSAKFAVQYATAMDLPYAIANKFRTGKDATTILGVIGDMANKKTALLVDDETVTGSSLLNTVKEIHTNHGVKDIYIAVSHMKLKKEYIPKLVEAHEKFGLKEVHTTEAIPQIPELKELDFVIIHKIARRFAASINRMHYNQSVSALHSARVLKPVSD